MTSVNPGKIRNVALLSHSGAGKTSLSEAMLYSAGILGRMGRVDEGTTASDYDPDEVKKKISINLTPIPLGWKDFKINAVDTPGYADFAGEVLAALRVCEAAIIVVAASSGVEVGTEQSWKYCEAKKMPRFIFINKMDRENVSFQRVMDSLHSHFGNRCVAIEIPIGTFKDFKGVVDLVNMKAYAGTPAAEIPVPEELKAEIDTLRDKLLESVAETDDALIEKYLGGEEISHEELVAALNSAILTGELAPVLCGSALTNTAIDLLCEDICEYLPSPLDRPCQTAEGGDIKVDAEAPLSVLVYKTSADPYVGKMTYLRVLTGTLHSNSQVWNINKNAPERVGQLFSLRGKTQETVNAIGPGDMGAVAKLTVTATGDTLGIQGHTALLSGFEMPAPSYKVAVFPKSKADVDKLGNALTRLSEEDLTLQVHRDPDTGETIAAGLGETQLEVMAERMGRKFGVVVDLAAPRVPYRETILGAASADYKHKKQSGGHGQYGHVVIKVEPGHGIEFVDAVVGGSVPRNFIPAVEKGVRESAHEGPMAGYPLVDIKVTLVDGSYHPVDSSEMAFKIAAAGALRKGLSEAQPILLEPMENMRIIVPKDYMGAVIGDLNTKRAQVQGMDNEDDESVIIAQAPLGEVQHYAIDLKSITQGRGHFKMEFAHYQQVPAHITQKLVADRQAQLEAEKT
ncbi:MULTISPECIES: elongation factor G [Dehalococcoides]|uniref:Elongation factor G n=2 Tax=Dehalococcoides mccartyi TaxID=61435 RepID=A0A142VCB0_9CHLR|nr:elongation factor G [Dehalococcoides mccartyi]AII61177.1 elongation factor G [Dehalococcoides mccartyi CG5]AMU86865.1 translation elongation factor G [Dehalococcoides mccartyi]AOV99654.1 translation elongation factor G-related protein [Dehalococcoides mccartyi]AQW62683.1 translation elongation factor G [Dehalococcoides mccartyi]AQX73475.1 elongation factor G [Dehalococcoides mccartyi]